MRLRRIIATLAIAATLPFIGRVQAQQAYPSHTVRLILPFGPGSATDTTARLFADRLTARWGKPVVVENRPGGDGLVALESVCRRARRPHAVLRARGGISGSSL